MEPSKNKKLPFQVVIRTGKLEDLEEYTDLLQKTFQEAYTDESIGLSQDCFSKEVFSSERIQELFKTRLTKSQDKKTWLAFENEKILGAITASVEDNDCELSGFYVSHDYQGKGIGKQLFEKVLEFASGRDIVLDTYTHTPKAIEMYERWGFKIDNAKGRFYRHWAEWPKGLQAECLYMRYKSKAQ